MIGGRDKSVKRSTFLCRVYFLSFLFFSVLLLLVKLIHVFGCLHHQLFCLCLFILCIHGYL